VQSNIHISVVTPVYGCAGCLPELHRRLTETLSTITQQYEIIMVNDASPDDAWDVIQLLASKDNRVKGINLSRNFGQHYAITAGLDYVKGDWVVVMDCDLQDQPEEIVKMYSKAMTGFDVVFGRRHSRCDNVLKKMSSRLFHRIFEYFTEQKSDETIANFGVYSKSVIDNVRRLREHNRCFPLFVRWVGFKIGEINIEHAPRQLGNSAYNLHKLLRLAINIVVSHSNKPLRLAIKVGFFMSIIAFIYGLYLIGRYIFWGVPVAGWTSVMVSIYFVAGLLLGNMGMLGLYIGKIFDEVKGRPLYIVKDTVGF